MLLPMAVSKPLIRFSLFQLISFAVAIAALGSWLLQDKTRNIVWLTGTLKYHVPATPDNYKKPVDSRWFGKAKPVIQILPNAELKNGEHLFRQAHEAGWQACRYHFHSNFEANIKYQIQGKYEDIELVGDDNIQSAAVLAYAHGYNNCQKQIDHLYSTIYFLNQN